MSSAATENAGTETVKAKILHCLRVYPRISPSMLQIGIGTSLPPDVWKPLLEEMINDGSVIREEVSSTSSSGRARSHVVLSLAPIEPKLRVSQ